MSNIIRFSSTKELLDFIRKDAKPNGNLSIRGVARLAKVDNKSIVNGAEFSSVRLAKHLTAQGIEGAEFFVENGFPPNVVIAILDYFANHANKKSAQAKNLILTFGTLGVMEIIKKLQQPQAPQLPQTYLEALKALVAAEEEKLMLEQENKSLQEDVERQAEVIDELFDYSSIVRIAKYNNVSEKSYNWRKLKAASELMNLEVKKVPCPRFVTKNLYSHDAWRRTYPDAKLPETTSLRIVK